MDKDTTTNNTNRRRYNQDKTDFIPIIGSGTIGSYTAYLLAKQGNNVTLYEDHDKIGLPCHCTGIVTSGLLDILDLSKLKPELIVNRLKKVKVVAPNNSSIILKSNDIVLDRVGFDVFLAEKAVDAGAKLEYNHKFMGFDAQKKQLTLKNKDIIKTVAADKVIAADGPNSQLFNYVNPNLKREPWIGVQVVIKGEFDKEMYEAYLGSEFAPGFFAWVVPESESTAIIGLATKEKTNFYFEKFMKQRCGDNWKSRVQSYRGGLIPLYNRKVVCEKQGVFLVGDAALQVKATTGGGIIPGMKAAQALADSFRTGKSYDKLWRKYTGKDLWMHLMIRKAMNNSSDEEYNWLVELANKQKPKALIENIEREHAFRLMMRLFIAEPRFLYFAKHML